MTTRGRAQHVTVPAPVLLAVHLPLLACAQPTSMETMQIMHALLVLTAALQMLKQNLRLLPQLLPVPVRLTRTAAPRRAYLALVHVLVMPTAVRLLIASAQPTHLPRLVPMTTRGRAQHVTVPAPALLAVHLPLLACAQPTSMEHLITLLHAQLALVTVLVLKAAL